MRFIIGANLKMNKKSSEIEDYFDLLLKNYSNSKDSELVIFPSFPYLGIGDTKLHTSNIKLGAQNAHYKENGEYTGEVSINMLADFNCGYVILGHSERRKYFSETNELINKKVNASINAGIKPILCIGENLEQKNNLETKAVLKKQLKECLVGVSDLSKVDIAYEPIWAIGTGEAATSEYVEEVHNYIRELLGNNVTRIMYGGSVKPENSEQLSEINNVNGFLIGGSALDAEKLVMISDNIEN